MHYLQNFITIAELDTFFKKNEGKTLNSRRDILF